MSEENGGSKNQLKVYISSVSSNKKTKKEQQRIFMILDSKKIEYEKVDIAVSDEDKTKMREAAGDPAAMPPMFLNGDDFLGDFEAFDLAVEDGQLNDFLRISN